MLVLNYAKKTFLSVNSYIRHLAQNIVAKLHVLTIRTVEDVFILWGEKTNYNYW